MSLLYGSRLVLEVIGNGNVTIDSLIFVLDSPGDRPIVEGKRRLVERGIGIMRCYPKYKDSGVEWIGEIPKDWNTVPLTKYLESIIDYRGRTPEKTENGRFLVTAKNIRDGQIDYEISQEFTSEDEYQRLMTRGVPQIGDVLFTTEAPLGEVANVDDVSIALAQRIIKFRPKQDFLNPYFLKYWILSYSFQSDLQR